MINWFFLLLFCQIVSPTDSAIGKAINLFETRHLDHNNIYASAQILEKVAKTDSNNLVAHYKLSQIYYTIGEHHKNKRDKLYYFNLGRDYAQKAIAIDSNSVWAHFWYMANLGTATQLKGIFSSLNAVNEIKRKIDLMLKLEPNNVWVLNAQANFYYELPSVLGGDLNKALEITKSAIKIDPNYSILYITLAKIYLKKKDYNQVRYYLNVMLTLQNPHPLADFLINDQPTALKLLQQINGK